MEWKGCGIFGKLWKYFHSRRTVSQMRVDRVRTISESERSKSSPQIVPSRQNDNITVENYKDSFVSDLVKHEEELNLEYARESNHTIAVLEPEQVRQRPHSAHIPFKPVVLFEENSTVEEVQCSQSDPVDDSERSSQLRLRPIQQQPQPFKCEGTSLDVVASKRKTTTDLSTTEVKPSLDLLDADTINTVAVSNPITNMTLFGVPQKLIMKLEKLTLPKRSQDMVHVSNKTLIKNPLKVIHKKRRSTNAKDFKCGSRIRHVCPYFMSESTYTKLKQEERWKELRRELRLELETQLDCDTINRANRARHAYQISMPSNGSEYTQSLARLLTVPLNLSCLHRLGVVQNPRIKPKQLQFPYLRPSKFGRVHGHRRHHQFRRDRRIMATNAHKMDCLYQAKVETETEDDTKDDQKLIRNAESTIRLYNMASNLVYNYSDTQMVTDQSPIWIWHNERDKNEDPVENSRQSTIYKNILEGLLVPLQTQSRRRDHKKQPKEPQIHTKRVVSGDQSTPSTSTKRNHISLTKAALEGIDWRDGLLTQGVRLHPDIGAEQEIFIRHLITLERLQLLTRLEESESNIDPNDELYSITRHRCRLKHPKIHVDADKRQQNLPPLNNSFLKKSKSIVNPDRLQPKFPALTAHALTSFQIKNEPHVTPQSLNTITKANDKNNKVSTVSSEQKGIAGLPVIDSIDVHSQWNNSTTTQVHQRNIGLQCQRHHNRSRHNKRESQRRQSHGEWELHSSSSLSLPPPPQLPPAPTSQQKQQRLPRRRRPGRRRSLETKSSTLFRIDLTERNKRHLQ